MLCASTPTVIPRARALLQRVVGRGELRLDDIATELVVTPRELGEYLSGERPMPLTRQLCLAMLVIDRVPALAREGYALLGQARAAIAVEHGGSPVGEAGLRPS
jgi:hypothetical protein